MDDTTIHVGDIGTLFQLRIVDASGVAIDISAADNKKLFFEKPDGSRAEVDAEFKTDGTDGTVNYYTIVEDIDQ